MRNSKLKISVMILSKWFQKLKNITKPKRENPILTYSFNTTKEKKLSTDSSKSLLHSSSSYFFNRSHTSLESKMLQISPRKSLHIIQTKRKTVYKPSPSSSSSVSEGFNKNKNKFLQNLESSTLKLNGDFKKKKVFDSMEEACHASNRKKNTLKTHHHLTVKIINKDQCRCRKRHQQTVVSSGRRTSTNSLGLKLKVSSPRIQVSALRSKSRSHDRQVLESFAVIKNSVEPKKDFKESMVEMIAENNLRASKDLEDLLACYLLLNHKEYHDLIINVFVQVWFEVINSTFATKYKNM